MESRDGLYNETPFIKVDTELAKKEITKTVEEKVSENNETESRDE